MTRLDNFERLIRRNAKNNSPLILSVVAGVGTIATAYLAGKATIKAVRRCEDWEELNGYDDDWRIRLLQRVKVSWTFYIPTAVSATSTIACVIAANRIGVRKTIAAQTALTLSQQAFSEYRTKVVEQIGDRKDNAIRAAIAEDHIKNNQPPSQDLLITGPGNYLCYEQYTGRYFASDIEKLRKAENELNAKLLAHEEAKNRSENQPYILHRTEFFANEREYPHSTLTYYEGDDVLCDEQDVPIYGKEKLLGELKFGHGSEDPEIVYIRNDERESEYEVLLDHGHYQVEVLGQEIGDVLNNDLKHAHIRKFRME